MADRFSDPFFFPAPIRNDSTVRFPPEWDEAKKAAYMDRVRKASKRRRARDDADPDFEREAIRLDRARD